MRGVDPERHNQLSGTVEEASGEMTIFEATATCDPEPRLSVAVDATLASEPGRPKVQVEGGLASLIRRLTSRSRYGWVDSSQRAFSASACRRKPSSTRFGPASATSGPENSSTVS